MCDPVTGSVTMASAAPYLMAGAGAYMQYDAANTAHKERKSILAAADIENNKLADKQANLSQDFAKETFDIEGRSDKYEQAAATAETGLAKALLDANGGDGKIASNTYGNVSSDYDRAKATATTDAAADIAKRAKLTARAGAGGMRANNEALRTGELATDVGGFSSRMSRNNRYAQNAVGNVFDGGSLAGGLLQGFASAYRPTRS